MATAQQPGSSIAHFTDIDKAETYDEYLVYRYAVDGLTYARLYLGTIHSCQLIHLLKVSKAGRFYNEISGKRFTTIQKVIEFDRLRRSNYAAYLEAHHATRG